MKPLVAQITKHKTAGENTAEKQARKIACDRHQSPAHHECYFQLLCGRCEMICNGMMLLMMLRKIQTIGSAMPNKTMQNILSAPPANPADEKQKPQ